MDIERNLKEIKQHKLQTSIETRFKTTFIGDLSAFEEEFSFLWGDRLPEAELTEREFKYRKVWNDVRNRILNNGNNQCRNALTELNNYLEEGKYRERNY